MEPRRQVAYAETNLSDSQAVQRAFASHCLRRLMSIQIQRFRVSTFDSRASRKCEQINVYLSALKDMTRYSTPSRRKGSIPPAFE